MKPGRAFELFVKRILLNIGFSEVVSDELYVFDGAPGQMVQGLGEAHNADVLLEPPVQTPFYWPTRLLIECKDYKGKVGLDIIRSALGLREDINHFRILEKDELVARRTHRVIEPIYDDNKYLYQVVLASINGFTLPAQRFAATHRIPLIEFNKMPFWEVFCDLLEAYYGIEIFNHPYKYLYENTPNKILMQRIYDLADEISKKMAIAITNTGQMLFLFRTYGEKNTFGDLYTLHWHTKDKPWMLRTNNAEYIFQLPDEITKVWLSNASSEKRLKIRAIECKTNFLSNMVVYYKEHNKPLIKMISINEYALKEAKDKLFDNN